MYKWMQVLQERQSDFIQQLELNLDVSKQHLYSHFREQVWINEDFTLSKIKSFSENISHNKKNHKIENNFLGKLGEASVKKYINDTLLTDQDKSDLISPVNCSLKSSGDGGRDFDVINARINTWVQVKTTRLKTHGRNVRELSWQVHRHEIDNNRLLIFAFSYKDIDIQASSHYIVVAGFIFCDQIREDLQKKRRHYQVCAGGKLILTLNIRELMHPGGILACLREPEPQRLFHHEGNNNMDERQSIFLLNVSLYEDALAKISCFLETHPQSYDALITKSACLYLLAQHEGYRASQDLDDGLAKFVEEQHVALYPEFRNAPQPKRYSSPPYSDCEYMYWQVVKDTTTAIFFEKSRPEAYVNRALAYEELSYSKHEICYRLFSRAIMNYSNAIKYSARRCEGGIAHPLFYYYRGKAYEKLAKEGLFSDGSWGVLGDGTDDLKWGIIYCERAISDLEAAHLGYTKSQWIGNAEKVKSDLSLLKSLYEFRVEGIQNSWSNIFNFF